MRAVAVLAVLVNHLDERWLPGGFLDVDIFVVISGYVVTSSLLARIDGNSWQFLAFPWPTGASAASCSGGQHRRCVGSLFPVRISSG
jgi:hypothetical protein